MDLLRTAVVDITTLVATCHALTLTPAEGDLAMQHKLRIRLRREIKRATVAYTDTLARTKLRVVDETLLAMCRRAAEQHMARAIAHRDLLDSIMVNKPGSLDGLAAARQDLWRLAQMTIYLRIGIANLRKSGNGIDVKATGAMAGRLRRRLRQALVAYARATLRTKVPKERPIATARQAALAAIGKRGAAEAERLSDVDPRGNAAHTVIRLGVTKALFDLALDWRRQESAPI